MEIVSSANARRFSNLFHAILRLTSYKVHAHNYDRHLGGSVERNNLKRRKLDVTLHASSEEEWKLLEEGLLLGKRWSNKGYADVRVSREVTRRIQGADLGSVQRHSKELLVAEPKNFFSSFQILQKESNIQVNDKEEVTKNSSEHHFV
ncbi:hypothetical protein SUGI_0973660 [Cryptomeria japonica]|nr:hypothetical protein SUGI_0973660 [Cryptomeria japonica]